MLFSVITFARNYTAALQKTAASLLGQELENFEWIVIEKFQKRGKYFENSAPNTRIIREWKGSEAEALNEALSIARGEYILFLKPEEILSQTQTLQKLQECIESCPADFIYGDYWLFMNGRTKYKSARSHLNSHRSFFTSFSSMVFRRNFLGEMKFDPTLKTGFELDFVFRAIEYSRATLYVPLAIAAGDFSEKKTSFNFLKSSQKYWVMQLLNRGFFHSSPRLYRPLMPPVPEDIPLQL